MTNPLEVALTGFVTIDDKGPDNFCIGPMYSRSAERVRSRAADGRPVVDIKRARALAREVGWDIASEDELLERAMAGDLS